jgi:hypothetical protein
MSHAVDGFSRPSDGMPDPAIAASRTPAGGAATRDHPVGNAQHRGRTRVATVRRPVRATSAERVRPFPGDDLIPDAVGTFTHGVTIRRPPRDVWPWLAQMGAGSRGGWYSYDWLDNGRQPSASRVVPDLQDPHVGDVFPAAPGVTEGFTVLALERDHVLTLGWLQPDHRPLVTWTFVLEEPAPGVTRLLVRARGGPPYRFFGLPSSLSRLTVGIVHGIMQRKQLLGIAARAEGRTEGVSRRRTLGRWLGASIGLAVGVYAAYAVLAWTRYGHAPPPRAAEADALLDRFMPAYEVVERHHIRVAAPAAVTLSAAADMELLHQPVVHGIFRAREVILRATPDAEERPRALLPLVQSLGWVVLAEIPGREVVVGAVTRPWEPNPTFRGVPPGTFAAFSEPGYVKIVWTLRADPDGPSACVFRTETRVLATDAEARRRFRRYWSLLSPGIVVIRWLMLEPVKAEAERRARLSSLP